MRKYYIYVTPDVPEYRAGTGGKTRGVIVAEIEPKTRRKFLSVIIRIRKILLIFNPGLLNVFRPGSETMVDYKQIYTKIPPDIKKDILTAAL